MLRSLCVRPVRRRRRRRRRRTAWRKPNNCTAATLVAAGSRKEENSTFVVGRKSDHMATANAPPPTSSASVIGNTSSVTVATAGGRVGEDVSAKSVHKRYEGLMMVRTKAIRGKGAWYWQHLEPVLVQGTDAGVPKAVKLRCALCDTIFSASNPSRTASEHLKRGTCPNFTSPSSSSSAAAGASIVAAMPKPISAVAPCSSSIPVQQHHHHHSNSRKRSSSAAGAGSPSNPSPVSYHISHLAAVDQSRFSSSSPAAPAGEVVVYTTPPHHLLPLQQQPPQQIVLSGGKQDLGALAMLEDSVKKLKGTKASPSAVALSKTVVDAALDFLSDWVYESWVTGAVSLSSVEHPKFRSFLSQIGLPPVSRRDLTGPRLDARYEEVRAAADARIRDALFFQLAADGWKPRDPSCPRGDALVKLTVNLPNGTTVFHRAVLAHDQAPTKYAEEVLWETVTDVCGGGSGAVQRCAGIIADKFKSKALHDLENQNHWLVNLSCQLQAFHSLLKDLARELPLFQTVAANCYKLARYFNDHCQVRSIFQKYQLQEFDRATLLRTPPSLAPCGERSNLSNGAVGTSVQALAMLEDILSSARAVQLAVLDESYKLLCIDDPNARELAEMIRDMEFWSELESVHSLITLIRDMIQEMEADRPLVGQCLPLWNDLRSKVKDWCARFGADEGPVKKAVEKRFKKCYHAAWSAAFILDPLYLIKDPSGKYLPPFKCLTPEQEKDVDKLITRLVSREEAHIALMELMKWRAEGLDPLYAQAVQVKRLDASTGKMKVANPQSSRLVWETCLSEFKCLGKVAVRLIFLHATSCGVKCSPFLQQWVSAHGHSRTSLDRAHKLFFVASNAKLERRDFQEDKDAELLADGEDDELNDASYDEGPSSL